MLIFYRLLFPLVFLFFVPGLVWKLIRRSGWKKTYAERFSLFSRARREELRKYEGCVWLHAVSVGETNLALTVLKRWTAREPDRKFVISTTTTTAQEIARNKAPAGAAVIFCPIDSSVFVRRTLDLLKPSALVIFETELWPNMVLMSRRRGIRTVLVNCRTSDRSFRGYRRFRMFFAPLLRAFDVIAAQTESDRDRLTAVAPDIRDRIAVTGNIKFDQTPPPGPGFDFSEVFGPGTGKVIVAASTHEPEEPLLIRSYQRILSDFPDAKLVIVPRHAERGDVIEKELASSGLPYLRRSTGTGAGGLPSVLLADTTGELVGFLKSADLVIMGKTLAGNDEGQNIMEPAMLGKPVICGNQLRNFRQAIDALRKNSAVRTVASDEELPDALRELLSDPEKADAMGAAAARTILENRGALEKTMDLLMK